MMITRTHRRPMKNESKFRKKKKNKKKGEKIKENLMNCQPAGTTPKERDNRKVTKKKAASRK